jgi:hypothetical protein
MLPFLAPIQPYLSLIKVGLLTLVITTSFIGGCHHGEQNRADEVAALKADKTVMLGALNAADQALRDQKADNDKRVAEAKRQEGEAAHARDVAQAAAVTLAKTIGDYRKQLVAAKARTPECKALLEMDVKKVCGL